MSYELTNRLKTIIILGFFLSEPSAWAERYVVQKGDTLSVIAHEQIGYPVYGKRGSLQKLLDLNPTIQDADKIVLGEEIEIEAKAQDSPEPTVTEPPPSEPARKIAAAEPEKVAGESGYLDLMPTFAFSGFESVDSNTQARAVFLSKLNTGLNFRWGQVWSKDWESDLQMNAMKVSMQESTSRTIAGKDQTLTGFGLNVARAVGDRWKVNGSMGVQQSLFVNSINTSSVTLESVPIYRLGAGAEYGVYSSEVLRLDLGGEYRRFFGTTTEAYRVRSGSGFRGNARLMERLSQRTRLEGEIYFETTKQKTTLEEHTSAESGFSIGIRYDLPGSR